MPSSRLPNYFRTYRKRAGFSQDEIAFLLGSNSGAKVSRYERFCRKPSLETVLAYEILFGVPIRELFAGEYAQVAQQIAERVQALEGRLTNSQPDPATTRKLEQLKSIHKNLAA